MSMRQEFIDHDDAKAEAKPGDRIEYDYYRDIWYIVPAFRVEQERWLSEELQQLTKVHRLRPLAWVLRLRKKRAKVGPPSESVYNETNV